MDIRQATQVKDNIIKSAKPVINGTVGSIKTASINAVQGSAKTITTLSKGLKEQGGNIIASVAQAASYTAKTTLDITSSIARETGQQAGYVMTGLKDAATQTWRNTASTVKVSANEMKKATHELASGIKRGTVDFAQETKIFLNDMRNSATEFAKDSRKAISRTYSDAKDVAQELWRDGKGAVIALTLEVRGFSKEAWGQTLVGVQNLYSDAKSKTGQAYETSSKLAAGKWAQAKVLTADFKASAQDGITRASTALKENAQNARNKSAHKMQEISESALGAKTKTAATKLGAHIAYQQLLMARKNHNPDRFAEILLHQNGERTFADLIIEDDARFLASFYFQAIQDHEAQGTERSRKMVEAATLYPIFDNAFAQILSNQVYKAYSKHNYGRSPEARQAYKSLALMFNQAGHNPSVTAHVDPAKLKQVHAAGKSMGYNSEASEILLYARHANKSLMAEFKPQDIAGAVRTVKKDLGVTELPYDMLPH